MNKATEDHLRNSINPVRFFCPPVDHVDKLNDPCGGTVYDPKLDKEVKWDGPKPSDARAVMGADNKYTLYVKLQDGKWHRPGTESIAVGKPSEYYGHVLDGGIIMSMDEGMGTPYHPQQPQQTPPGMDLTHLPDVLNSFESRLLQIETALQYVLTKIKEFENKYPV